MEKLSLTHSCVLPIADQINCVTQPWVAPIYALVFQAVSSLRLPVQNFLCISQISCHCYVLCSVYSPTF